MLQTLNWLSVEQSITKANVILIYKIKNKIVPQYLSNLLTTPRDLHDANV